jgi:hypothetical protein
MAYVSGLLPQDRNAKPVNFFATSEFPNVVGQWKPSRRESVRQPIYDGKYLRERILLVSFIFIVYYDVVATAYPVKPFSFTTTVCNEHAALLLISCLS